MEAKVCELINEIACLDELNAIIVVRHDVTAAAAVADHLWLMGRDQDAGGNTIPGARIQETYDLIERDMRWHPEITNSPKILEFVREVKERFQALRRNPATAGRDGGPWSPACPVFSKGTLALKLSPRRPGCYAAFYGGSRHLPAGSSGHLPA
jgi:hypothetical protein